MVRKVEGKTPFERLGPKWQDNDENELMERESDNVEWISMPKDPGHRQDFVDTVVNILLYVMR